MRTETRNSYIDGLTTVASYILDHLDDSLDPRLLAGIACFSPFHFHRVFRGMMGESIGDCVRRLRLERAAWRLISGSSVTEVAFDAGYESHAAFTRAFRDVFGVPPAVYLERGINVHVLPCPTGLHFDPHGGPLRMRPQTGDSLMEVEIRKHPARSGLGMSHGGPYWQIGPVFGRLAGWAAANNVQFQDAVAVYYDDPDATPPEQLRSAACLMGTNGAPDEAAGVHYVEVPGGTFATTIYTGPYSGLSAAWGKLCGEWLPQSGHKGANQPPFELYLNDPMSTPPEQLKTELYLPLQD